MTAKPNPELEIPPVPNVDLPNDIFDFSRPGRILVGSIYDPGNIKVYEVSGQALWAVANMGGKIKHGFQLEHRGGIDHVMMGPGMWVRACPNIGPDAQAEPRETPDPTPDQMVAGANALSEGIAGIMAEILRDFGGSEPVGGSRAMGALRQARSSLQGRSDILAHQVWEAMQAAG
jgi:hypothetical protein